MPPRGHQPSCTRPPPKVGFSVPPRRDPVNPYTSEHKQQYPEERIFLWEVTAHLTTTKDIPDLLGCAFANTRDGNDNDDNRHRHQHPNYHDPLGFWLKKTKNSSFCLDDKKKRFFSNKKRKLLNHTQFSYQSYPVHRYCRLHCHHHHHPPQFRRGNPRSHQHSCRWNCYSLPDTSLHLNKGNSDRDCLQFKKRSMLISTINCFWQIYTQFTLPWVCKQMYSNVTQLSHLWSSLV